MPQLDEALAAGMEFYFPALLVEADTNFDITAAIENAMDGLTSGALSWARLNQVMHLCSQAGMSEGFFRYYFLIVPPKHPYPVTQVFLDREYTPEEANEIKGIEQFKWGIRRFIYDAMLYWGNFRQAYRDLRQLSEEGISHLFSSKQVDALHLLRRGRVVDPVSIPHDQRYLISEIACKTYDTTDNVEEADHVKVALAAFRELKAAGGDLPVSPRALRDKTTEARLR